MTLSILHETSEWLVLNKPAHLHTVNLKDSKVSLETMLRESRPELSHLKESGILHRLDFETSGCILVAKSEKSFKELSEDLRTPDNLRKSYWAITSTEPKLREFDFYFFSRYRGSKKVSVKKTGKAAERGICEWRTIRKDPQHCLLEVDLIGGGLRHQIRAGLSYLGHPLLGDSLYGGESWSHGIALHARSLTIGNEKVSAPVPNEWPLGRSND